MPRRQEPRLRVYVGRALWYALARPARLDVQVLCGRMLLVPASAGAGYAVVASTGMPRIWCSGVRDLVQLDDGRYDAEIRDRAIVVGRRID